MSKISIKKFEFILHNLLVKDDKVMSTVEIGRHIEQVPVYDEETGKIIRYDEIVVPGVKVTNPSLEMVYGDGWEDFEEPAPTLAEVKEAKKAEVDAYDASPAVNEFFIGNASLWLDKVTRTGLMLRFDAEKAAGKTDTTLWYGQMSFNLAIDDAVAMLYALEVYASACYDNTASHKLEIDGLTSKDAIEQYDYTTGYPEKLHFGNE